MTLLMLLACGEKDESQDLDAIADEAPAAVVIEAPAPRTEPGSRAFSALGDSIDRFAFDLLARGEGQSVFSPASVAVAWAMLQPGARGATEAAIATVFHQPDFEQGGPEAAYGAWLRDLDGAEGPWTLNLANRIWAHESLALRPDYEATLSTHFGAGVGRVDFSGDEAREAINAWVAEQTGDRIPRLLQEGAVDGSTRLVLTNAIAFQGTWETPFSEERTAEAAFQAPSDEVQVPTMRRVDWMDYSETAGVQAVRLPYKGGRLAAWVLLHDQPLDWEAARGLMETATPLRVDLSLPRFELRQGRSLRGPLTDLGLGPAFGDAADLGGLADGELFVSDCLHEAWIKVDEVGTEAAAATAVGVSVTSLPPPPREMKVDRPFTFLVVDEGGGSILFLARVENPAAP